MSDSTPASAASPALSNADRLLIGLNDAQREATTHKDGPLLVLAGPGSGKTRVVTHRIAWLMENGVRDSQIAALTFTNKAADEMKTRLQTLSPGSRVWIGTFHRFCAYLLRYYAPQVGLQENYVIYDVDQSKKLLEEIVGKRDLPNGVDLPKIASAIGWAKNSLVAASEYCAKEGSLLGKIVEEVYPAYQEALRRANAVDFDDLLFHVAVLLKENEEIRAHLDRRFKYILVDEYQDTNVVQYAIARALSIDYPNLAVTGDPDQSIYGWRGANIQNILNFEQDFEDAKVVRLEQNYRSDKSVLRVADALIKHNLFRKDKDLYTERGEGVAPRVLQCLDQQEEAEAIAAEIAAEVALGKRRPRDYAVFYRMNALSRNLEYALKRYGVPFQLVRGLEFFNRKEVKDLCAYLQLIHNPNDVVSFRRVINLPARGVGRVTLARLENFAVENNATLFEAARAVGRVAGVSTKAQKAIASFVSLVEKASASLAAGEDLEVVLSQILTDTKYVEYLRDAAKTEEDAQRLANVQELLSEVREFDADCRNEKDEDLPVPLFPEKPRSNDRLGRFLEQIALVNDVDSWDENDDRVSLMTLHAAKGLEFPVVYLVAVEDGVLPHERSLHDKRQLEEERRLLFVGLTRAEEELRLSRTRFREFRGSFSPAMVSRFLFEFPKDGVDSFESVEDWRQTLENAAAENPDAKIAVPKMFPRQDGRSQRQALWEEGVDREPEEEVFRVDGRAPRNAGRRRGAGFPRGFADDGFVDDFDASRRRRGRGRADFADAGFDDCVDAEPVDDFSQEAPENDLEFDSSALDFDADGFSDAPSDRFGDYDGETEIRVDDDGVPRAVAPRRAARRPIAPTEP
ncbi:MAG: UvrD-helicase domain-containing protein, partial [Thermoguttaceae bacterium]|nr:UvrD-helicase domain-containing protein [Thermoguttaceae bacterium]